MFLLRRSPAWLWPLFWLLIYGFIWAINSTKKKFPHCVVVDTWWLEQTFCRWVLGWLFGSLLLLIFSFFAFDYYVCVNLIYSCMFKKFLCYHLKFISLINESQANFIVTKFAFAYILLTINCFCVIHKSGNFLSCYLLSSFCRFLSFLISLSIIYVDCTLHSKYDIFKYYHRFVAFIPESWEHIYYIYIYYYYL